MKKVLALLAVLALVLSAFLVAGLAIGGGDSADTPAARPTPSPTTPPPPSVTEPPSPALADLYSQRIDW